MNEHIEWFEAVLNVAIGVYFQHQGFENLSMDCVKQPTERWLEKMTNHPNITFEERVIIMLALMPHIKPQALDCFFSQMEHWIDHLPNSVVGRDCHMVDSFQLGKLRFL